MEKVETSNGFIVLHRKITEWEWYDDTNTFRLFVHCLLRANHKPKFWHGISIERGSFVSSYQNIAAELKLSIQKIRTSLNKLKSTGEITYKSTSQYSIITVNNYNQYQDKNEQVNTPLTNDQQSNNNQITTNNNENNVNNKNKNTPRKSAAKKSVDVNKLLCNLFEGEFSSKINLKPTLEKWFQYKKDRNESYKSELSIKALVKKIIALSDGNTAKAEALVENAIANNWQGVFGSSDAKFLEQKRAESKENKSLTLMQEAKKIIHREDAIDFVYKNVREKMKAVYKKNGYFTFGGFEWSNFLFEKFKFDRKVIDDLFYKEIDGEGE